MLGHRRGPRGRYFFDLYPKTRKRTWRLECNSKNVYITIFNLRDGVYNPFLAAAIELGWLVPWSDWSDGQTVIVRARFFQWPAKSLAPSHFQRLRSCICSPFWWIYMDIQYINYNIRSFHGFVSTRFTPFDDHFQLPHDQSRPGFAFWKINTEEVWNSGLNKHVMIYGGLNNPTWGDIYNQSNDDQWIIMGYIMGYMII